MITLKEAQELQEKSAEIHDSGIEIMEIENAIREAATKGKSIVLYDVQVPIFIHGYMALLRQSGFYCDDTNKFGICQISISWDPIVCTDNS